MIGSCKKSKSQIIWTLVLLTYGNATFADTFSTVTKSTWDDGVSVFTSPLHITKDDVPMMLTVTTALGGSLALDRITHNNLLPYQNLSSAHTLLLYGNYAQFAGLMLTGVLTVSGWSTKDPYQEHVAWELLESFLWANAVSETFKLSLGRRRPYATDDPFELQPGSMSGSFPSGHTISAFAAATTLSEYYPTWKVYFPAYAAAGAVAFSRVYGNQHWGSDVMGGTLMGAGVSYLLWKRDRRHSRAAWDIRLQTNAVEVVKRF